MSAQECFRAIDRLHELERNRALPEETLRMLDSYWRDKIFDDNDLFTEDDRIKVQNYYIESLGF